MILGGVLSGIISVMAGYDIYHSMMKIYDSAYFLLFVRTIYARSDFIQKVQKISYLHKNLRFRSYSIAIGSAKSDAGRVQAIASFRRPCSSHLVTSFALC